MDVSTLSQKLLEWSLSSGLRIVLIVIISLIAIRVARMLAARLSVSFSRQIEDEESKKRVETLASVIRHLMTVIILVVALMIVLGELGVEIGPILAAAGIVGLAVGFGAQNLVKDVINGFFILLNDQIRVGDVVQIGGKGGLVEKVNLRMTILRDLSGNVHFVPNGQIDVVTNMSKDYSYSLFDIGVAYREDVDEVVSVVRQVDEALRADADFADDILEPIEILGLDKFADSAVIIRARTKTRPAKQWRVAREFNRRLKRRFDEKKIEIPFPHVTLYMGEDKEGKSPPLRIFKKGKEF
ncbi:MAG: mechanosensitive ion channel family protein [Candidatus Eiseniibacteriota bacterium]|nr:MAG: mechanosensitive ion channel family protein [Candidatus Eisenbacteria bacterium]